MKTEDQTRVEIIFGDGTDLTDQEQAEVEQLRSAKGDKLAIERYRKIIARKHMEFYLEKDKALSVTKEPYGKHRGYVEGIWYWKRKDDQAVTAADILSVKLNPKGQKHIVRTSLDNKMIIVEWACDSGG